jgi:hypothetical protein
MCLPLTANRIAGISGRQSFSSKESSMKRYTLLAVASMGLAAFGVGVGCQSSGHAEAPPADTARPQMAADKPAATPAAAPMNEASVYNMPYVATTDTVSMNVAGDTSAGGTIKKGDTVWLKSDAAKSGLVPARTADGQIIQVRASDFKAK